MVFDKWKMPAMKPKTSLRHFEKDQEQIEVTSADASELVQDRGTMRMMSGSFWMHWKTTQARSVYETKISPISGFPMIYTA